MSYIKHVMEEEYQRLQALSDKYRAKIESFPKGCISVKKRNKSEYLYLAGREAGKVKFLYVGPLRSEKARQVMEQVALRKSYTAKLKQVKSDLREVGRVIHGRKL